MRQLHKFLPIAVLLLVPSQTSLAKDDVKQYSFPSELKAATVLLITSSELLPAWQEYAAWKTSLGKPTKLISVDQISEDYPNDLIQESIRLCVRDHIDNHRTRWIVLGGDCRADGTKGVVPGGHRTMHRMEPAGIPTDIVYLSPTNWDADGDGKCGEWPDDQKAITYPDGTIGLGRIPVRTAGDVKAFTKKVIEYESNYPTNKFATEMIYTCTVPGAYPKVRRSWDDYVSKGWRGRGRRYFVNETPWDEDGEPGSYPLSADNMVDLVNKKEVGKLHIHGHGIAPAWVLEESAFHGQHVAQLNNQGAYPLITTVSCFTGQYDAAKDPSIVEQMLRVPKAGSVAIVAPIRTGKPHFSNPTDFRLMVTEGKLDGTTQTMTRYWQHGLHKKATTGEAIMRAKADMASDATKSPNYHLCICELNLLGDPTLDMRPSTPKSAEIEAPQEVSLADKKLTIKTNQPKCIICAWQEGTEYVVTKTDDGGAATFDLENFQPGEILVTATGRNLNATRETIKCIMDE